MGWGSEAFQEASHAQSDGGWPLCIVTVSAGGWCWVIGTDVCHWRFLISNLSRRCDLFSQHVHRCFGNFMLLFDSCRRWDGKRCESSNWCGSKVGNTCGSCVSNKSQVRTLGWWCTKARCRQLISRSHPDSSVTPTIQKGCFSIISLLCWSRENHPSTLLRHVVTGPVTKGAESWPSPRILPLWKTSRQIALLPRPGRQPWLQVLAGLNKSDITLKVYIHTVSLWLASLVFVQGALNFFSFSPYSPCYLLLEPQEEQLLWSCYLGPLGLRDLWVRTLPLPALLSPSVPCSSSLCSHLLVLLPGVQVWTYNSYIWHTPSQKAASKATGREKTLAQSRACCLGIEQIVPSAAL